MEFRPIQSDKSSGRRRTRRVLDVLLALTGAAAVGALILEYGGFDTLRDQYAPALHIAEGGIVAVFVIDRLLRLFIAPRMREYFRENWVDFALIVVLLAAIIIVSRLRGRFLSAGALYVAITQAYILVALLLRAVSVNLGFAESGIHPSWMLLGSFAVMCLIGSGLLMLPAAQAENAPILYYPDALFTAVSATCVTGLVVRDTGRAFSPFGQSVILVLIQLGGLGIMLFGTMMAFLMGKGLTMRSSEALGQMVATDGIGRLASAVRFVLVVTVVLEVAGAAAMYPMFATALDANGQPLSTGGVVWHSAFHSVSSFCNAGFALYGNNMMQGVREGGWVSPLRDRWQMIWVMCPLIILGGLGFPVLQDLAGYVRTAVFRIGKPLHLTPQLDTSSAPRPRLSLHSKLVLGTSGTLVLLGMGVLLLVEPIGRPTGPSAVGQHSIRTDDYHPTGDWASMGGPRRVREALFQSVSARTAGFNTVDMAELSDAGKLWMCGLMIVGGSPASTAGGMKTVTIALLVLSAYCVLRRRNELEIFQRSVSTELLRRTVTLAVLYLGLLGIVTLLLCVAERGDRFINLLFEACSACGTVGLSTGETSRLTLMGKLVIVAGMFIGRLGPLTLLLALTSRIRHVRYSYPTENVVIG
jgi:trk/ktr system potassium uptake protein